MKRHPLKPRSSHCSGSGVWRKSYRRDKVPFSLERARLKVKFQTAVFARGFSSKHEAISGERFRTLAREKPTTTRTFWFDCGPWDVAVTGELSRHTTKTHLFSKFDKKYQFHQGQTTLSICDAQFRCCQTGGRGFWHISGKKNISESESYGGETMIWTFFDLVLFFSRPGFHRHYSRMTEGSDPHLSDHYVAVPYWIRHWFGEELMSTTHWLCGSGTMKDQLSMSSRPLAQESLCLYDTDESNKPSGPLFTGRRLTFLCKACWLHDWHVGHIVWLWCLCTALAAQWVCPRRCMTQRTCAAGHASILRRVAVRRRGPRIRASWSGNMWRTRKTGTRTRHTGVTGHRLSNHLNVATSPALTDSIRRPLANGRQPARRRGVVCTIMLLCLATSLSADRCCLGDVMCPHHGVWTDNVRVGEASNPGPAPQQFSIADFDDPEGETLSQSQSYAFSATYYDVGGDELSTHGVGTHDPAGATTRRSDCQWDDQFRATTNFLGQMPGWYFTTGNKGLGYYRDGPASITIADEVRPMASITPIGLSLDKLLQQAEARCDNTSANPSSSTHDYWAYRSDIEVQYAKAMLLFHKCTVAFARSATRALNCSEEVPPADTDPHDDDGLTSVAAHVARIEAKIASAAPRGADRPGTSEQGNAAEPAPADTARQRDLWPDRRRGCFSFASKQTQSVEQLADDYNTFCQTEVASAQSPHHIEAGIMAASTTFRACGLWAIDTANANAWSTLRNYVARSAADVVVAQELKTLAGDATLSAEDALKTLRWKGRIGPCTKGPGGGPSAGTAVLTRQHVGMTMPTCPYADECLHRFIINKVAAICKRGVHIGSLYLTDSVGPTSPDNLKLLDYVASVLMAIKGPWIIGGDFNCTPQQLMETGFVELIGGVIQAPRDSTCGLRTMDFFIVSRDLAPAVAVHCVSDGLFQPHTPVRLLLRAAPRAAKIRVLTAPRGFRATLPYGPETLETIKEAQSASEVAVAASTNQLDVDQEFVKIVVSVERQLSLISGHTKHDEKLHAGRALGPSFKWRCPLKDNPQLQSMSPLARAWTKVASWLQALSELLSMQCNLTSIKGSYGITRIQKCLLHHAHFLPAGREERMFVAWQQHLTQDMLQTAEVVSALSRVADNMAQTQVHSEQLTSRANWISWVNDGPSAGIGRQHRMSRVAIGWVRSKTLLDDHEDDDDNTRHVPTEAETNAELQWDKRLRDESPVPMSLQQSVDDQADTWSGHWACDTVMPECEWPADMGPLPPQMSLSDFKSVLWSFPVGLGLGWDALHPRALLRLDDAVLAAILRVLFLCETAGRWPSFAADVIVALLPKSADGVRCIGLFAWLPKVWAKLRRKVAAKWEHDTHREFLYAGTGRGAEVATWKQAARAEHTSTIAGAQYGQTLLDLIKAFDTIPWHLLVTEAIKLIYSLWILRLSIATYRAPRHIRMNGAFSAPILPRRSLAAGGGLATSEMRLALISIVDRALNVAPQACPTLYVDDLSVEVVGGDNFVLDQLVNFTKSCCSDIIDSQQAVSDTKSYCTASTPKLGAAIQEALAEFGIKYKARVISLGAAMGAGRRRNATALSARLKAMQRRVPRFRKLARNRVSTARLLRTGGTSALSYGQAITGVSPTTLLAQRRVAATIAAPHSGSNGQDLDMALMLADGSRKGRADPAFEAHLLPIVSWAKAVWHTWLPHNILQHTVEAMQVKLTGATSLWQHVRGPTAATLASAWRIGWKMHNFSSITTDLGKNLDLKLDPPVVVQREVVRAVRRWREAAVFRRHTHLGDPDKAHGLFSAPLWKALNGPAGKDVNWTAATRAALRSALAGRQWPQLRCWNADFAEHDRCMLCVHDNWVARTTCGTGSACTPTDTPATTEEYTHDDILAAPIGSIAHRVCDCPSLKEQRDQLGPSLMGRFQTGTIPGPVKEAFATALFSLPRLELSNTPPAEGTFNWVVNEANVDVVKGRIYTDASRVDDDHPDTMRLGWAFVVLNDHNHVVAVASGVPPHYVDDIPGAEAWALLQAATVALPGSEFYSDCKVVVDAVHLGRELACGPNRPLTRILNLLFVQLDDVPSQSVVWMPAHTSEAKVGVAVLSNGAALTHPDRQSNQRADTEAKAAARLYAVHPDVMEDVRHKARVVEESAKWLGHATWLATHGQPTAPRDSQASRIAANIARYNNYASTPTGQPRPQNLLAKARKMTVRQKINEWTTRACSNGGQDQAIRPHQLMVSGKVIWCNTCGAYATGHAVRLVKSCQGPVDIKAAGGRSQQLRKLRAGKHPKLGHRMADTVPWNSLSEHQKRNFGDYESRDAEEPTYHIQQPDAAHDCANPLKRTPPPRGDETRLMSTEMGKLQLRLRARLDAKRARANNDGDEGTGGQDGNTPHQEGVDNAMSTGWPGIDGATNVTDEPGAGNPLSKEPCNTPNDGADDTPRPTEATDTAGTTITATNTTGTSTTIDGSSGSDSTPTEIINGAQLDPMARATDLSATATSSATANFDTLRQRVLGKQQTARSSERASGTTAPGTRDTGVKRTHDEGNANESSDPRVRALILAATTDPVILAACPRRKARKSAHGADTHDGPIAPTQEGSTNCMATIAVHATTATASVTGDDAFDLAHELSLVIDEHLDATATVVAGPASAVQGHDVTQHANVSDGLNWDGDRDRMVTSTDAGHDAAGVKRPFSVDAQGGTAKRAKTQVERIEIPPLPAITGAVLSQLEVILPPPPPATIQ